MVLVGRVGLEVKGAWDSSVAYATMDVVTYNNSTYIAKQAVPAGTLPTNTTYWELSLDASLLQPKTMSSPVTIGGESKTTVEAAVGALEDVKADKTAISSVETTNTAVSAHAVGSYFINASGQFVKTTSAIAIGDTIIVKPTVGYNCEATTIGDVLESANTEIKTSKYQKIYTVTGNGTTDTIATIFNKIYNDNTFSIDKFYILIFDNDIYNITTYLSNQVRFGKIGGNNASTAITNCHLKASDSKIYVMSINNAGAVTVTDNSSAVTSYTFNLYQVG